MKVSSLIILAAAVSSCDALAAPSDRRAFMKAASTATAFTVASSPAFAKDAYDLDSGDVVVEPKEKKENKNGGIVTAALGGSVLLSLPFFLPNLMRLAGINNAKNPTLK